MDDQWCDESGPFGFGELNEAGEELLSFLAYCMQHLVHDEEYTQTNLATHQVSEMALYWLCNNEERSIEKVFGCVCNAWGCL